MGKIVSDKRLAGLVFRTSSFMATSAPRSTDVLAARRLHPREIVAGVDGGGTKTHAVVIDQDDKVLGEGYAGPSNPLRVGIAVAAATIREALDRACAQAHVRRTDIVALEIGLAGARRKELSVRMEETLRSLGIRELEVVGDAEIALFGATDGQPGVVVIAGTGSVSCGINARHRSMRAGGWGPMAGDEGGGSWIARRALSAVAHAADGRGPETALTAAACAYFHVSSPDDLATAIYAPAITNERIAGFAKLVIDTAKDSDVVASGIIKEAGKELGIAAAAVIRNLKMEQERFQVAYVGGVFAAGELVLETLRNEVLRIAPKAFLAPPRFPPAVAAARMAREHNNVALAV
jgi:N-acetylglucosamine kinase-like BadF-type ATPase